MLKVELIKELLDALERVGQYVLTAARLPRKRREELLKVLSATYEVLDRVLLMVIGRIGRVIDRAEQGDRAEFASELANLGWYEEWLHSTREMSLSSGLRRMHAELRRAPTRLFTRKAVKDWEALKEIMERTMDDEGGLAEQIALMLTGLSQSAEKARSSDEGFHEAWDQLTAAREALQNERKRLLKAETDIYAVL